MGRGLLLPLLALLGMGLGWRDNAFLLCYAVSAGATHGASTLFASWCGERGVKNRVGFKDFRTENGSGQGQNPVLTGLSVPSLLDSGT